MLTSEQKEIRINKITASEIASILGLNPWESAHDVYRRKCKLTSPKEEDERNRAIMLGHIMEGPLIEFANQDRGMNIKRNSNMFVHPTETLFSAIPDGFDDEADIVAEVKSVGPGTAPRWKHKIPDYVFCQVTWQLACTGKEKALVIANPWNEVKYYEIEYHEKLFELLKKKANKFWEFVQKREPPPDMQDDEVAEAINRFYPDQKTDKIIIDNDNESLHMQLQAYDILRDKMKEFEKSKETLRKEIIVKIGEDKGVQCKDMICTFTQSKDLKIVNWKNVAAELNATDELIGKHTRVKPGFRSLRVKKVKI